jgi:hypothetical protein
MQREITAEIKGKLCNWWSGVREHHVNHLFVHITQVMSEQDGQAYL